jgi:hypothetical protein
MELIDESISLSNERMKNDLCFFLRSQSAKRNPNANDHIWATASVLTQKKKRGGDRRIPADHHPAPADTIDKQHALCSRLLSVH